MEKIYFPLRGPHPNNSKRSRGGAPPGPSLGNPWPGFPRLGIARVVGPPSALIASGETNFLCHGRISPAEGGVGPCEADRKNRRAGPDERGRLKPLFNSVRQLPDNLLFSRFLLTFGMNQPCFLDSGNARRPSIRRRREILPWPGGFNHAVD